MDVTTHCTKTEARFRTTTGDIDVLRFSFPENPKQNFTQRRVFCPLCETVEVCAISAGSANLLVGGGSLERQIPVVLDLAEVNRLQGR